MKPLNLLNKFHAFVVNANSDKITVKANHISCFYTLYHYWNKSGRKKRFNLNKKLGMKSSGISSPAAYYKVINDLKKCSLKQLYNKIRCLGDPYPNAYIKDKSGTLFINKKTLLIEGIYGLYSDNPTQLLFSWW